MIKEKAETVNVEKGQINIFVRSDKSIIIEELIVSLTDFEKAFSEQLHQIQKKEECVIYLRVSKKVNISELSKIKDVLKSTGIKRIKYEPFTEQEEILYQV